MANTLNVGNGDWATKENSLLGYNSESGNYKPLPFDFTRASNGTFVNKSGLIETAANGVPRIDFLGNTSGALLLEPQRSNLINYSSDFSNAVWAKNGALIATANASTSPSGETDSTLLYNTGNENRISQNISVVSGNSYTMSVYLRNNGGNNTITFEAIGYSSQSITINNDWARYDYTITATSTASVQFRFLSFDNNINLYAWGAQVEQGSYSTSLINTQGSAVTRVADACTNGGNDQVINSTEGVLYWEASALADDGTDRRISLSDGTLNNYVSIGYSRFSGNINAVMFSGGVIQTTDWGATGISQTNNNKFAMSWGSGTMKFYINGVQKQTASVTSPIGMNNLRFSAGNGSLIMFSNTKDLRVYNTALTDAELAALTTI